MTNTPGDDQPQQPTPEEPGYWERRAREEAGQQGAPGYWEKQAQQPPYGQQPYPDPQPYGQPGYPPASYAPQAPYQYVPDHPRATMSLILGILGVVLCQVVAPFAWVIGKRTVNEIDASGGRVGGRGSAQAGYVLGIIGTVLLGLGVLYMLAVIVFGIVAFTSSTTR